MITRFFVCLWIFMIIFTPDSQAQLSINEVCSRNHTIIYDEEDEFVDWIEIKNIGATAVDLSNYHMTDDPGEPDMWTFPNHILAPDSFIIIFASGKSLPYHTSFKLSGDGEAIAIFDNSNLLIDALTFPRLKADHTFGIVPSSGQASFFEQASPGSTNIEASRFNAYNVASVVSSHISQVIDESMNLTLSIDGPVSGLEIRYTIDGSEPGFSSDLYSGPISISNSTVVKAIAASDTTTSFETLRLSFLHDDQTGLPMASIAGDPFLFFDQHRGIYITGDNADTVAPFFGANYWRNWIIPVQLDYFDHEGDLGVSSYIGLRIHGGTAARIQVMKPLRFLLKDRYGVDAIDYSFFESKSNSWFKRFIFRNSGSDFNLVHFRDGFVHSLIFDQNLDIDASGFQPLQVYLNGEYLGLHHLREKIDEHYIKSNYNYEAHQIDLLEEDSMIVVGNLNSFYWLHDYVTSQDLSQPEHFEFLESQLDVGSFTDYFILQTFFNNWDWPGNNLKYWKPKGEGKWRYILFDLDVTLSRYGWTFEYEDNLGRILTEFDHNPHVNILKSMLENDSYKKFFINRYADLINTSVSTDTLLKVFHQIDDQIGAARDMHLNRWGNDYDSWEFHRTDRAIPFIEHRPDNARFFVESAFDLAGQAEVHIKTIPDNSANIKLNTIELHAFPWKGTYFTDVPISLEVEPRAGYSFSHWQVVNSSFSRWSESSLEILPSPNDTLVAIMTPTNLDDHLSLSLQASDDRGINVVYHLKTSDKIQFELFDSSGRQLFETQNQWKTGETHVLEIPTSFYSPGIYYLVGRSSIAQEMLPIFIQP